jgi:hypothetical protein
LSAFRKSDGGLFAFRAALAPRAAQIHQLGKAHLIGRKKIPQAQKNWRISVSIRGLNDIFPIPALLLACPP